MMRAIVWVPLLSGIASCGLVLDFDRLQGEGSGAAASTGTGSSTASVTHPPGGTTSGLLALGASCEEAAACGSGFCAEGICCDAACEGPCRVCSPMGTCGVRATGFVCGAGSCTEGTLHPESACSPAGECLAPVDVPCIGDTCDGAACAGCTAADCTAAEYCPLEGGPCKPKLALGASCTSAASCASASCADGVCCDAACDGTCEVCDAAGHCAPRPANMDPDNECADQPGCGLTGECSGATAACALEPAASACGGPSCSAGMATLAPSCDGAGSCVTGAAVSCGNYACDDAGTGCRTACSAPEHCTNGTMCIASQCRASDGVGNGCPNGASDCPLGFCVDGFCCQNACTGICTACSTARTGAANGQCAPVLDFTDPKDSCEENTLDRCAQSGRCVAGQCALQPAGTPCGETCVGNGYVGLSCDGAGMCNYNSTGYQDCGSSVNCCVHTNGDITCAEPGNCPQQ